jgi:hypothetical protein
MEIQGFLSAVYGRAAPAMRRYLALRHSEITSGEHLWIDQNVEAPYLTDRFLKNARALLQRAYQKADADPARRRISRSLLSLDYVEAMRRRKCRVHGSAYGPDDLERVKRDTRDFVQKAEALGITHLREGYPLTAQAPAFEELAKNYSVVELNDGTTSVKIVPELEARIVMLNGSGHDQNILRIPDPGEFSYPHAGGLFFSVFSDYLSHQQRSIWRVDPSANDLVSLIGQSEQGLDLNMNIRLESGILRVRFTAANPGPVSLPVALRCQAEFALRPAEKALLHYTTGPGKEKNHRIEAGAHPVDQNHTLRRDERADGEWTLAIPEANRKIRNCFHAGEVGQCGISWSFRSSPRLILTLWSPEVIVTSGEQVSLESQYQLT